MLWRGLQGGWRLPEAAVRPANTIQYKDRALQTPFQMADGRQVLEITLEGDECSEELAFVFKVPPPLPFFFLPCVA